MKVHAFIIQVHKEPELLKRILNILQKDNHYFFINVDKKSKEYQSFKEVTKNIPNTFFLPHRISVYHGGISQIECTLSLLKEVIKSKINFSYVHSISGQDYPLRSNEAFDSFFEQTNNSFMAFDSDIAQKQFIQKKYPNRVNLWHLNNSHSLLSKIYKLTKLIYLSNIIVKRNHIKDLQGGWSWFSWNKETVLYVLNYLDKHPDFYKRFNHTCCADELIFHTILQNKIQELKIEKYKPLRYVSWDPKRPIKSKYRPYILTEFDYEDIINSMAFFCRKVDLTESSTLLNLIDKQRNNKFDIENSTPILLK